jgi:hypothetical protein
VGAPLRLVYEVENRGSEPVTILVNLPTISSMQKLELTNRAFLDANQRRFFEVEVEGRVTVQPAVISVAHAKIADRPFAVDVIGAYVSGRFQTSSFWIQSSELEQRS